MAEKKVGRNGWLVMVALCRKLYSNGTFARMGAENIAEFTGMTLYQVARGMSELRNKMIIAPVNRRTKEGYYRKDRSSYNHVAQYCVCQNVWERIEKIDDVPKGDGEPAPANEPPQHLP